MKSFLYHVADTFYRNEGNNLSQIAFVFPNRRSGVFFKHYLKELAVDRPSFSPTILTINNLMTQLSGLQPIDKIELLFLLYSEYSKLRHSSEPFDKFVFWGEILAGDFDDVDKYMVDAHRLFTNIKDLKELETMYLEPEQLSIIRQFWETFFRPNSDSDKKVEFNSLWSIMCELYTNVRQRLSSAGVGYEGMIFRSVAEAALNNQLPPINNVRATSHCNKIVFVGFNAITEAERIVMKHLRDCGIADFYWDYYAPTLQQDDENRANYFIKENIKQFPSRYKLAGEHRITTAPQLSVIPVSSSVGQAKQTGDILKMLIENEKLDPHNAMNTAIVLPDEELLMPMLYSIPRPIENINITMGYSLRNTSVASLFDAVAQLQQRVRWSSGKALYYHIEVSTILNHRLVTSIVGRDIIEKISKTMNQKNMAYVTADFLTSQRHQLLQLVFSPITHVHDVAGYMEAILDYLFEATAPVEAEDAHTQPHTLPNKAQAIEHEYIYHYYNMVSRLNDVIEQHHDIAMNISTYFALLNKLSLSIPFEGEPLSGLQVMGVLETRTLDFENIVILSMNEGVFPMTKVAGSFIPYNLRRGYNMATTEHQDSIYAYYFYRLIGRAKCVYMLYDSRSEGLKRGEMSRFIYQLKHHYTHLLPQYDIKEYAIAHSIEIEKPNSITIPKKGDVATRLRQFLKGDSPNQRPLSASSVKTYLNCPLQFYLMHVESMRCDEEINEEIDSSIFGTIYHNVMAHLYDEMKGDNEVAHVTASHIDALIAQKERIMEVIKREFGQVFYKQSKKDSAIELTGHNFIIASTVQTYVLQTLECDKMRAPFTYVASEMRLDGDLFLPLENGKEVRFKALIDRIDRRVEEWDMSSHEMVRIIDYKTGKDMVEIPSIEELFNTDAERIYGAFFQTLLYCRLYRLYYPEDNTPLLPLIYKVRNAFSDLVQPLRIAKSVIKSYDDVQEDFEKGLNRMLEELFDEETPFVQTQVIEHCKYCDFKNICKRN